MTPAMIATAPQGSTFDDPTPRLFVEDRRRIGACVDIDGNSGVEVFVEVMDHGTMLVLRHYGGAMDGNEVCFGDADKLDHLITALMLIRGRLSTETAQQ